MISVDILHSGIEEEQQAFSEPSQVVTIEKLMYMKSTSVYHHLRI